MALLFCVESVDSIATAAFETDDDNEVEDDDEDVVVVVAGRYNLVVRGPTYSTVQWMAKTDPPSISRKLLNIKIQICKRHHLVNTIQVCI